MTKPRIRVRTPDQLFPLDHKLQSGGNISSTAWEQSQSLVKSSDKDGEENVPRVLKKKLEFLEQNLEKNKKMKPNTRYVGPVVVNLTTASYKGNCNCDDCKYVTSPHVDRMKRRFIVCRCHPCVLDRINNGNY